MVLSGKMSQAVRQATNRYGGWCLLPDKQCKKIVQLVAEVLLENQPYTQFPPVVNPM